METLMAISETKNEETGETMLTARFMKIVDDVVEWCDSMEAAGATPYMYDMDTGEQRKTTWKKARNVRRGGTVNVSNA